MELVDLLWVLGVVAFCVWRLVCIYLVLLLLVPLASVYQEHQIWSKPKEVPSLSILGYLKVYLFNVTWMSFTLLGSLALLPMWIMNAADVQDVAHEIVERYTAMSLLAMWVGPVEIRGKEHLPPNTTPHGQVAPVYIANHSSQLDAAVVYCLRRKFKWIAKKSVLYLPGVGPIMYLANHVFINRKRGKNQRSVSNLYEKSDQAVQSGMPMFIFPEGTRRITERLVFKNGAFNIALKNKCRLVCVSIKIPLSAWNNWYPMSKLWGGTTEPIVMTVHKPIPVKGTEAREALNKQCFDVIYSVLPEYGDSTTEATTSEAKKEN